MTVDEIYNIAFSCNAINKFHSSFFILMTSVYNIDQVCSTISSSLQLSKLTYQFRVENVKHSTILTSVNSHL